MISFWIGSFCTLDGADPDSYRENRKPAEARLAASKTPELKPIKPFVLLKVNYFLNSIYRSKRTIAVVGN